MKMRLFLLAWSVRLGLAGLLYYLSWKNGHPGVWSFAPDAANYHEVAKLLAAAWHEGQSNRGIPVWTDYIYFIAILYYFFGPQLWLPILVNTLLGAVTVVICYQLARKVLSEKYAIRVAIVLALFPSFVLFSTQILKDALVIFLICLALLLNSLWLENKKVYWVLLLIGVFWFLTGARWYVGVVLVLAITLAGIWTIERGKRQFALLALLLNLIVGWQAWGELHQTADFQQVSQIRNQVYAIDNAGLEKKDISSWDKAILALPSGLFSFYFAPTPRQWLIGRGIIQKLNAPEMLVWYGIVLLSGYGLFLLRKKGFLGRSIVLFVVGLSIPYSLVIANIGAIYRLREQLVPFLLIAAAATLERLEVKGWPGLSILLPWRSTVGLRK